MIHVSDSDVVKSLIMSFLDGEMTGGSDIDGLALVEEGFVIIEYLRCVTVRPFNSHPNRYWDYGTGKTGNKQKFISLWNLAQATQSKLILVNYEDSREQFKLIEVVGLSDKNKIYDDRQTNMDLPTFKSWLMDINDRAMRYAER